MTVTKAVGQDPTQRCAYASGRFLHWRRSRCPPARICFKALGLRSSFQLLRVRP